MASITADCCVVGGGLMGSAVTFMLSKRGVRTVLIERNDQPGNETTARSGAIIRAHYGVSELVSLARESNMFYANFADEVGDDCGFVQCGYSVLVDAADVGTLRSNVAMHKDLGVNVSLITGSDLAQLVPNLIADDIAAVAYEPEGGYANPAKTVNSYVTNAMKRGAEFIFGQSVVEAEPLSSGWTVRLSGGDSVSAHQVVICTGNWSRTVGAHFGVELPVDPVRAQIVVMQRPERMRSQFPIVSDLINLAYFRTDGHTGLWVGSSDSADLQEKLLSPDGFDEDVGEKAIYDARRKCSLRFHDIPSTCSTVERGFSGLYETTPDWQPIIGTVGNGLHAAVGFSGHGFKLSPVIGSAMADIVTGSPVRSEFGIFGLNRFEKQNLISSKYSYQRAKFLR